MNKIIFAVVLIVVAFNARSQSADFKIGVFDIDIMVQVMPAYRTQVDSVLQDFIRDSLTQEYNFYQQEFARIDSTMKAEAGMKRPQAVLDLRENQRQQLASDLTNFQQLAEQRIQIKRAYLARPLYDKVMSAYKRVMDSQKYQLVLKPNSYEQFSHVDNVFIRVAKELNVSLPKELIELR